MSKEIVENIIQRAIRKDIRMQFFFGFIACFIAFLLGYSFYGENVFLCIIAVAIFLGALLLLRNVWTYRKLNQHPILNLLSQKPQSVIWVYTVLTQRMPFGLQFSQTGTVYFKKTDGTEQSLSIPAKELNSLSDALQKILPHATFGYSVDKAQWYTADPWMLYREEEK